ASISHGTTSPSPAPWSFARRVKNSRGNPTSSFAGMTIRPMADPVAVPPRNPARSIKSVFAPWRAADTAAAMPATPPPQTRTSTRAAIGRLCGSGTIRSSDNCNLNSCTRRVKSVPWRRCVVAKTPLIGFDVGELRRADVLAAQTCEVFAVARTQGLDHGPVLVARLLEVAGQAQAEGAHPMRLLCEVIDGLRQLGIPAGSKKCAMKRDIGAERGVGVLGRCGRIMRALGGRKLVDERRRCAGGDQLRGSTFEDFAHRIDLFHFARRGRAHRGAAIGRPLDEAHTFEPRQGFAYGVTLGRKARDQRVFDQPLARMQAAENDVLFEPRDNRGDRTLAASGVAGGHASFILLGRRLKRHDGNVGGQSSSVNNIINNKFCSNIMRLRKDTVVVRAAASRQTRTRAYGRASLFHARANEEPPRSTRIAGSPMIDAPARPKLTVWYNTKCPVCNAGIDWQRNRLVAAARSGAIAFRDINLEPDALSRFNADLEDVRRRLHAVDAQGTLYVGADCAIAIWLRTPGDAWLGRLLGAPVIRPITRFVYDRFADLLYAWNRRKRHW